MTQNITKQNTVSVGPLYHRGDKHIGIAFDFDPQIYRRVKSLPGRKFSKTRKCWYIPYSEASWTSFIRARIPYTIVEHFDNTVGAQTNSENFDIVPPTKVVQIPASPSMGTMKDSGIGNPKGSDQLSIQWYTRHFYVKIGYDTIQVENMKKIFGAWWNLKYGNWVVKATVENLENLQAHFSYWSEAEYHRLGELIKLQENPIRLELYVTPEFPEQFLIKLKGYGADFRFLQHLPDRSYDKMRRHWRLPLKKELVERLIEHYREKGAEIINRIPAEDAKLYSKPRRSITHWKNYFISRVKQEYRPVMEEYLATLIRQSYSQSSVKSYASVMIKYLQFLGTKPLAGTTPEDVNYFLDSYADEPRSKSFYNQLISAIKFYYERVVFMPDFIIDRIERPRRSRTLPTILSTGEVERMLRSSGNLKHTTILYAIYSSGLRLSELLGLRLQDIHWDRNQILVKHGKGSKDRMVMFSEVLKEILRLYLDQYQPQYWLFEGSDSTHQYSERSVQQIVWRAAKKAGIQRKVTPHTLRHCFATHLLDGGTDIRYIQELLGHKDIKTTLIYTHVTNTRIKEIRSPLDRLKLDRNGDEKKPQ